MYKLSNTTVTTSSIFFGAFIWIALILIVFFYVIDIPTFDSRLTIPTVNTEQETVQEPFEAEPDAVEQEVVLNTGDDNAIDDSPSLPVQEEAPQNLPLTPPIESVAQTTDSLPAGWYVQVGAYKSKINANVERLKYENAKFSSQLEISDEGLVRILLGPYLSEAEATKAQSDVSKEMKVKDTLIRNLGITVISRKETVESEEPEKATYDQVALDNLVQEIVSDVVDDETVNSPVSINDAQQEEVKPELTSIELLVSGWYVQVGAFKSFTNAEIHRMKFAALNFPAAIENGKDDIRRVVVGPFTSKDEADKVMETIANEQSIKDVIVRNIVL